jgi:hypothetical protein
MVKQATAQPLSAMHFYNNYSATDHTSERRILIHSECFRQRKIATVIRSREQHMSTDEKRVLLTRQEVNICIRRLY